ncbi:hypothetical protein TUA1478L_09760 [Lactiplantibacillus plantarum]
MNHQEVADRVLNAIGKNNIQAAAHCATRLRLVIKDESKIDQQALDDDADVKGPSKLTANTKSLLALAMSIKSMTP